MRKMTVLTMILMGSVYGMDGEQPQPSGQEQHQSGDSNLLSRIPKDLRPIIENYHPGKIQQELQALQKKLNEAKSIEEIIALGETDKHCKVAPLKLNLYKFKDEVTDQVFEEIVQLFPQMIEIDLMGCKNITDAGFAHLAGLKNLQSLRLGRVNFKDAGVAHLAGLTNLKNLKLYKVGITDVGLANLHLNQLMSLDISENNITDKGLALLASGTPQLTELLFEHTKITPKGLLTYLPNFKHLTLLDLGETAGFYEDVAVELRRKMPGLDITGEH